MKNFIKHKIVLLEQLHLHCPMLVLELIPVLLSLTITKDEQQFKTLKKKNQKSNKKITLNRPKPSPNKIFFF